MESQAERKKIPMKIKDMPNDDRPYERCQREGPERLSDVELLSIIIRTGSPKANSLDLASKILALNYPKDGILGLLHLSLPELTSIKGIGNVKGIQLLCVGELSRRIWKRKALGRPLIFRDPGSVAEYYQEDMRHQGQEQFHVMLFNTKQMLIQEIQISKGTVNEALRYQAVSLILVHNHPSGDPEPSREDVMLTQRVKEAGVLMDIRLQDHVIIGEHTYVSMKERGLI